TVHRAAARQTVLQVEGLSGSDKQGGGGRRTGVGGGEGGLWPRLAALAAGRGGAPAQEVVRRPVRMSEACAGGGSRRRVAGTAAGRGSRVEVQRRRWSRCGCRTVAPPGCGGVRRVARPPPTPSDG